MLDAKIKLLDKINVKTSSNTLNAALFFLPFAKYRYSPHWVAMRTSPLLISATSYTSPMPPDGIVLICCRSVSKTMIPEGPQHQSCCLKTRKLNKTPHTASFGCFSHLRLGKSLNDSGNRFFYKSSETLFLMCNLKVARCNV